MSARLPALLATLLLVGVCAVELLISVGVPVWKAVYFARLSSGSAESVDVGVWALCTQSGHCTKTQVGLEWDASRLSSTPAPGTQVLIKGLTAALILHPIAAGFAALAALWSLCGTVRNRSGGLWGGVVLILVACLLTLASLGISLAVVLLARSRYMGTVSFGPALWMSVGASAGAVGASLLAVIAAGMASKEEYSFSDTDYPTPSVKEWASPSVAPKGEEEREMNYLPAQETVATSRTQLNPSAVNEGYGHGQAYNDYPQYYPTRAAPAPAASTWDVSGYINPNDYYAYRPEQHAQGLQQYEQPAQVTTGEIYDPSSLDHRGVGYETATPAQYPQNANPAEEYGVAYAYPPGLEQHGMRHSAPAPEQSRGVGDTYDVYDSANDPAVGDSRVPPTPGSGSELGAITFGPSSSEERSRTRDAYARVANTVHASRAQRLAPQEE